MRLSRPHLLPAAAILLLAGCGIVATNTPTSPTTTTTTPVTTIPNLQPYTDPTGTVATYTVAGLIDQSLHFFQPLGINGRTCATCHQLSQGMSITPATTLALFNSTSGNDPLFNAVDGANCPTAATGDSSARSLLLTKGLIRIPVTVPATAQFTITVTHDPYNCAIALNTSGQKIVSVYRRPLATAGLPFLSSVMWDARETLSPLDTATTFSAALTTDLSQQAADALSGHMQGATLLTSAQLTSILAFEQGLYTAQITDIAAGSLSANGATGGPAAFAAVAYYPGINDAFGADPTGRPFNNVAFTLYDAWRGVPNAAQSSINRGQGVFNNAPMSITNVHGINDNAALGSPNNLRGTCTTCHDAPNIGSHSLPLAMDTTTSHIATSDPDPNTVAGLNQLTAPDLPIYQITGCRDAANRPVTYTTSDPGKALSTGLCADVNRTKVPSLRGLAARAPYFHGGSAATVAQLVNFYDVRFQMNLTPAQKADLINFLNAL